MRGMSPSEITARIKALTAEQGFCRTGIAPVQPSTRGEYYRRWLADGRNGRLEFLERNQETRLDPGLMLDGARSVVVVSHAYGQPVPERPDDQPRGRVARYAWGRDYHQVVKKKLFAVCDRLRAELPGGFGARVCVDTAPIFERELAELAGVGWVGKNNLVIDPQRGSYLFLGIVFTTLELVPDTPMTDQCGTCTLCLDACPTAALRGPRELAASRCISYLTVELREEVPAELTSAMGDWVFGCDACQEVCPYNGSPALPADPAYAIQPSGAFPALDELLSWSDEDRRAILKGSAMRRATLKMLKRNATIAKRNGEQRAENGG